MPTRWTLWIGTKEPNLAEVLMYVLAQFSIPSARNIADTEEARETTVRFLDAFGLGTFSWGLYRPDVLRETVATLIGPVFFSEVTRWDELGGRINIITTGVVTRNVTIDIDVRDPDFSITFDADCEAAFRVFSAAGAHAIDYLNFPHAQANLDALSELIAFRKNAIEDRWAKSLKV